ncbi:hypothetical protein Salat_0429600 [Sesamum alatum]|uniref:Leucine-rich repeat-containing N-terminal plant-type domain-containing protein n=1 Tax=Sesamum alatum TaxID=300844 RepID=A0AAE1Z311_9LAMI|nr:hypothetical protein Salat_0429600 [Sesamum alatum]
MKRITRSPLSIKDPSFHTSLEVKYEACLVPAILSWFCILVSFWFMIAVVMSMVSGFRAPPALITIFIWLLVVESFGHAAQTDIDCLRDIQASLQDPFNYLSSWRFNNTTEGFICKFAGVDCWHPDENKVLNIRLGDMGLRGKFPLGVSRCSSLTGLDLSGNSIRGNIPSNISKLIGFVTSLDLSSNHFSGEIPVDLANCSYLNILKLDNNQLRGRIPPQIGLLNRIKTFSVSRNQLSGPVPRFISATIPAESYANNPGLCDISAHLQFQA